MAFGTEPPAHTFSADAVDVKSMSAYASIAPGCFKYAKVFVRARE
jgi:hypothetical protein